MHCGVYNTCECIHTLRKKCICVRACAHMQRCRSFFAMKLIANLSWVLGEHRAGCRLPPAQPPAQLLSWPNPSPDAVRSRNPSKSMLAHDAVAAAELHKHYSIICVGAGLIQFVYGSRSPLATELTHHRNSYSPFFARVFRIKWKSDSTFENFKTFWPPLTNQDTGS